MITHLTQLTWFFLALFLWGSETFVLLFLNRKALWKNIKGLPDFLMTLTARWKDSADGYA